MSRPSPRSRAEAWGVDRRYQDSDGEWQEVADTTLDAVLAALGAADEQPPTGPPMVFTRPGGEPAVEGPSELVTEDGGTLQVEGSLPPDLPLGYHTLRRLDDGRETTVVVSPGRCPWPPGAPTWGWAVQLPTLRSDTTWGIGDLGDLRELGQWSADELHAGLVMVSPLHAPLPTLPQQSSPYSPSSRRFRNPLFLRIEEVPGAAGLGEDLERWAAEGRSLNADRRVDRDAAFKLKMKALTALWERFSGAPSFDRFCQREGAALEAYATFCVLTEQHNEPWTRWPEEHRHPDRPGVAGVRREREDRVRFHQWVQWLLDEQLSAASSPLSLVHDLAVGVDPAGADAWMWQDALAGGVHVGAPPDTFNRQGQDWGLAPFDPWRLRAAAYRPFVETLRAAVGHGGGLRVDHVMGLFRLWWVPPDSSPADGAYVRYPADDLLDIVALEAHRAGTFLVGEDLGTVEPGVREELGARDILSYRLLWFEEDPPAEYPLKALAAVTTHDLPTVAGLWTGSDLEDQRRIGLDPNEESVQAIRRRLRDATGLDDDAPVEEVVEATYRLLAGAPSLLLTAGLDDVLCVPERHNMPGTTGQWPNWSLALPVSLEQLRADPRAHRIATLLSRSGGRRDG